MRHGNPNTQKKEWMNFKALSVEIIAIEGKCRISPPHPPPPHSVKISSGCVLGIKVPDIHSAGCTLLGRRYYTYTKLWQTFH